MVRSNVISRVFVIAALVFVPAAGSLAQDAGTQSPTPRFVVLPAKHPESLASASTLPLWTYTWSYGGTSYSAKVIGSAPGTATTTIPVFIVPIKLRVGGEDFSPETVQSNRKTALHNTEVSPLLDKTVDFVQGGIDLGKDQYIDAVQRASFYGITTNTAWHTEFGKPTVLPTQLMVVPAADGALAFNLYGVGTVALVDVNYLDTRLQKIFKDNPQITSDSITIFVTYNTNLTNGAPIQSNCCDGGYHTYNGTQVYTEFSYVGVPGAFAQDVSGLSHELAEAVMDPFTNNTSPCGILEVADPLERNSNYGAYPYTVNGFTYNLQDITLIPYFGAPASTSVNGYTTFQGESVGVCANGS